MPTKITTAPLVGLLCSTGDRPQFLILTELTKIIDYLKSYTPLADYEQPATIAPSSPHYLPIGSSWGYFTMYLNSLRMKLLGKLHLSQILLLVIIQALLGCQSERSDADLTGNTPATDFERFTIVNGWTVLSPSADSRVFYVSSSGNDSNDGLSEASPKRTITNALLQVRDDHPDWIKVKSGDTFSENRLTLHSGGLSISEPFVITSYGDGPRPILNETGLFYWGPNEPPGDALSHVAIVGLDFAGRYSTNPTASGNGKGILFRGDLSNILVEDCRFDDYSSGLHLQSRSDGPTRNNITIRRNTFVDSAEMGILASQGDTFTIEENIFDYNGFTNGATKFSHNIYLKEIKNTVLRNNIFARGSNFGTKLSGDKPDSFTDFVVENNLYFDNGLSLDHSSGPTDDVQTTFTHNRGSVTRNVFTEIAKTFTGGLQQDLAVYALNTTNIEYRENLFVHKPSFANNNLFVWGSEHHKAITVAQTVIYNWPVDVNYIDDNKGSIDGYTKENNQINMSAASYLDPGRTVGTYFASIGGQTNALAFLQAARGMSKSNWNPEFTADAVNNYIRAGFNR